ncbi:hypothetical protein RclHR1_28670001 [Rhizophagus clarus]|uniref:Uncharacterized protein n=1 Tax=Rhizophagus clarus TaxID=94130 RepID=A0A2Z6RHS5_9GLOM|nr:hypothetical protein RclHR1_28670001 [Rhizophagus clarus]
MRPWTSFQRSGTLFQGGPLSLELFRDRPVFRRSETPLKVDYDILKVWNLEADRDFKGSELEADRRSERSRPSYFEVWNSNSKQTGILKVWNSNLKWTGSEFTFEADHNIQRFGTPSRLDSLSQRTIKIFQFEADQGISKMEPHFEVDQICGFQIRFTDFWKLPET